MAKRKRKRRVNLGEVSIKSRCPREGLRVSFEPGAASGALYNYRVPPAGTKGRTTTVPLPGGRKTCLRGPGGGLVYVKWDNGLTVGISSWDLDRVK